MSRTVLLIASLACAVVLLGCSTTETTNNSNASVAEKTGSSAPASSTPAAAAASNDDKIGVPECDDYIAKYESCVNKIPEMVRAQYKDAIAKSKAEWRRQANDPATRAQLASICKQANDQQAAALKSFGCNF